MFKDTRNKNGGGRIGIDRFGNRLVCFGMALSGERKREKKTPNDNIFFCFY